MAQENFGASQITLVASALTLAGQAGWTQRDWELANQKEFWERMKLVNDGKAEIMPLTPVKPARGPSPQQQIISFYAQVFGLCEEARQALKELKRTENLRLQVQTLILGDDVLTLEAALDKIDAFWPNEAAPYTWSDVSSIKIPKEHERPKGAYILHHTGEEGSDKIHKGKSYNDALGVMNFMTPKEYVIFWAYTLWTKKIYLDASGWTRLCATWPDGSIVCGSSDSRQLNLGHGHPADRHSDSGPREVSFALVT